MSIAETLPMVWPESPNARRTDPVTSHEAADLTDTARSRAAVLTILRAASKPLSDEEIDRAHRTLTLTPFTPSRMRTARHELVERGSVVAVGVTRSATGRKTTTWSLRGL